MQKVLDAAALFAKFGVPVASPGERHFRDFWVNTPCPFCVGHHGNHLGFCLDSTSKYFGAFICHRCGGHSAREVISKLLKISDDQARVVIKQFGGDAPAVKRKRAEPVIAQRKANEVALPPGTCKLRSVPGALRYIRGRGFDPDELEGVWGVQATGPLSILKYRSLNGREVKLDLRYRIVIPITNGGRLISWQCRDWTGKAKIKYLTCPPELEAMFHKATLYGLDQAKGMTSVFLEEGAFDVWQTGPGALGTFGIGYQPEQVRVLSQFEEVTLIYDSEPQAQIKALSVIRELREYGVITRRVRLAKGADPGSTSRSVLQSYRRP